MQFVLKTSGHLQSTYENVTHACTEMSTQDLLNNDVVVCGVRWIGAGHLL